MKEYLQSIINEKYTVIQCDTAEECAELVTLYLENINGYDLSFNKKLDFTYGNNTCIHLERDQWSYCDIHYFTERNYKIVNYRTFLQGYKPERVRGFELVSESNRKSVNGEPKEPTRGTSKAMAYDFYAPTDYIVSPNEIVKIWTDIKAYMQDNEGLILNVRSSMGGKFMLANTQGWIDADYYNNEKDEGNIGIFLKNISNEIIHIRKHDRIAQGMFVPFLVADNGNTNTIRKGGFGHTNDTPN